MNPVNPSGAPPVSVVIASIVGPPFIDDCLEALRPEVVLTGAEVIVVACAHAGRIAEKFPWVRLIDQPERETVPQLRRRGVEAARGEIVAIIEEHCLPAKDWLRQALRGLESSDAVAVGGPIVDYSYRRRRDWVVYFLEYNGSMPPAPEGAVYSLNGANIAYRRQVLMDHAKLMAQGYWEANLNPVLISKGYRFLSAPGMVVHHRGPFDYGYYLQQRYWFSRAFAGHRANTLPLHKRLIYAVTAPLIPALLLARIGKRVLDKRCRVAQFIATIPLLIPAVTVYVAGEWMGYIAGPGDALQKVE